MIKRLRFTLPVIVALLGLFAFVVPAVASTSTVWESYNAGDDAAAQVYGVNWYGQTFTVDPQSHSIIDVRFLAYRVGTPSTLTVSIRETGDDGFPIGDDITSGTINGDSLTTDTDGSWYGVSLTETSLSYGEVYAIVIRAEAGDGSNYVDIRENSSGAYADGQAITSSSGGIAWSADTGNDIMFQVDGAALLTVAGAKVFSSYLEDNDMLIVLSYQNTYVPYYPDEIASLHFWLQLRTANGNSTIAQTVCRQWGYMPGSIYLSANQAAGLTVGVPYRVYLAGASSENATAYYSLTSSDWQGDALNLLPAWVLTTAHSMATYYDTALTTQIQNAEVLNSEGGALFATGVPSLLETNPELFQDAAYTPDVNPINPGPTSFDTATTWEAQVGPQITALANLMGRPLGGVSGKYVLLGLFFIGYLIVCAVIVKAKADPLIGTFLCIIPVLGMTWLRVIDFQLIAATGAVAVIMTVYRFHWSRT